MTQVEAALEGSTPSPPPALPFAVQPWSRDPSAAVPSKLTGRKLLVIVLGLTATWVALLAGAVLGTLLLIARIVENVR